MVEKSKKLNIKSHKFNLKNSTDNYNNNSSKGFWDDIVNRNRLLYCAHMNRKSKMF